MHGDVCHAWCSYYFYRIATPRKSYIHSDNRRESEYFGLSVQVLRTLFTLYLVEHRQGAVDGEERLLNGLEITLEDAVKTPVEIGRETDAV